MSIDKSDQPMDETLRDFSQEKAVLVTLQGQNVTDSQAQAHLDELEGLVNTMGITQTQKVTVRHRENQPKYLIGSGKAQEIVTLAQDWEADLIIFDDDLSPSQQRNWEALGEVTVIDRQEVILEIFSQRAHTREAVLQVGLARMEYSLPRLQRSYTHMSRQRGGARGNKGGGEMQLEVDRRVILRKIDKFKEEIETVRLHRQRTRQKRQETSLPSASIVGYTNAGKSTLLNRLAEAGVLEENKLFATLDPTTRRTTLGQGLELLLTDTVGFIQKLPHHLVDAFRSTLEEAVFSDFLIHVVDASHPDAEQQMKTTAEVLHSLGSGEKPQLLVLNKTDALDPLSRRGWEIRHPEAVLVSLKTGEGLEELKYKLISQCRIQRPLVTFHLPLDRGDLVSYLYKNGQVVRESYEEDHIALEVYLPPELSGPVKNYVRTGP